MAESSFLAQYSVQRWLEMAPQGYLEDTTWGHDPGLTEPEELLADEERRIMEIGLTVQLVAGERCALAASSGLVNAAPDAASKTFLATQTLDEARHVEIFTRRLMDLGVKKDEIDSTVEEFANPNLVKFAETLLERVNDGDFVAGVVGQNIVLEGMAFSVFELLKATSEVGNPKFAQTLAGTIADERRHVGFGENRIGSLITDFPERKSDIERMQGEMSYHMLNAFSDMFSASGPTVERQRERLAAQGGPGGPVEFKGTDLTAITNEEVEALLSNTVLDEFKVRLGRIGLDYHEPVGA